MTRTPKQAGGTHSSAGGSRSSAQRVTSKRWSCERTIRRTRRGDSRRATETSSLLPSSSRLSDDYGAELCGAVHEPVLGSSAGCSNAPPGRDYHHKEVP